MMGLVRFRSRCVTRWVGSTLAGLFSAALGLGTPAPAHAQEPSHAPIVAWTAPSECPNAESIAQRLSALGGGRRFADAGSVRGQVVRETSDWVLTLQIAPASATGADAAAGPARVLRARDCDDLVEAGAVAIAIALGGGAAPPSEPSTSPLRVRASIGPARTIAAPASIAPRSLASHSPAPSAAIADASPPAPAENREVDAATADEPAAPEDTPSTFGFAPSAGLVFDAGSLGGTALGPGVEAELHWAGFGAGVYGLWLPPRQISVASAQAVELSLLSVGLRGCYRADVTLPLIDLCAGGEFGALSAAGRGLLDASRRRDPWGAATVGALIGADLGLLLRVGARLEAVLPFSRERYLVNQNEVVHEVPAASARVGLLLAGSFGQR
jgi:hypothetical protein